MKLWQETFAQAQSKWQLAGWLLAFAFPVFALVVDKAASTVYAIYFLAGLWLLIRGRYEKPDPLLRWVLIAFAAYFFVGVLSFFLGEQTRLGEKILGRDIRFFAAIPVFLFLLTADVSKGVLTHAFAFGGLLTGVVAILQVFGAENSSYRASGETISILFGHLSAALLAINFMMSLRGPGRGHAWMFSGMTGALVAVLLSATRGAFFSVLLVAAVVLLARSGRSVRHSRFWVACAVLVTVPLVVSISAMHISGRTKQLFGEIETLQSEALRTRKIHWPAPPACINTRQHLEWLVLNSDVGGKGELLVDVSKAEHGLWGSAGAGCTDGYEIVLRNATGEVAWIYFPARSAPPTTNGGGQLLVRGRGALGLGGAPAATRRIINASSVQRVSLDGDIGNDGRHLVVLRPGDYLQIVPLITLPGEYEFTRVSTSLGRRLYMWIAAGSGFKAAPILGEGTGTFPSMVTRQATRGEAPWQITRFDHAHNEILTVAAERGILGLITLFGVYAAPFWLFWRRRDVFGRAGMAFVASIFISGLTETIFNHSLGITYYCMLVLLLATAPREPSNEPAGHGMPSDKLI